VAGKPREQLDETIRRTHEMPAEVMDLVREVSGDPLQGKRRPGDPVLARFLTRIGLEGFGKSNGFVILSLKAGGVDVASGFILADREFQGDPAPIERVDVRNLEAFAEMAALAMSSDSLRNTLSDEHKREEWKRYFRRTMHTLGGALYDVGSPVSEWDRSVKVGTALPGQMEPIVKRLQAGLEKLGQIVTSLKGYSQPAMVSFGKVNLRVVVRNVAEGQGDVVLEECDEDPVISGDVRRLEEALRNLVTNSREALLAVPVGERLPIRVGLRVDGKWAMIEVTDEAGGFSDEIRNSIGLEWNSTKGKGRGMGLPIAKRIVEGHGGEFRVDSTRTRGSSILMKLPIYKEEGGASNAETATG
jgi:signal transduction histidine kinase